jgi:Holliday junction resolvasome RuvABC endonuclease subunit
MAAFTTAVVVASAGVLTMARGSSISFTVTWGSNISQFRFNRIWAGVVGASDEDTQQSVTIVSEGSQWSSSSPASTPLAMTLRGNGQSGAPIQARIQVLASQVDTF